jgi:DNA-binding NarL/FixJ family response regulator
VAALSGTVMIDVLIIDNENVLARHIDAKGVAMIVHDDEIRALNAAELLKPEIIMLNYTVPANNTVEFIALLCRVSEHSKIVLIAQDLADDEIIDCLLAGAKGYLQINEMQKFINKLIPAVHTGEAWITRRMVAKLIDRLLHRQVLQSRIKLP